MNKPDYPKIFFVGAPLTFMVWVFILLLLAFTTDLRQTAFPVSIALTVVFFFIYLFLTIKMSSKTSKPQINPEDTNKSKYSRPVSGTELIFTAIIIVLLITTVAVCEIFFGIPAQQAFKKLWPFFLAVVVIEKIIKKRAKTHNK